MRYKKILIFVLVLIGELSLLIAIAKLPVFKSWAGIARHDFTSAVFPLSLVFYIVYKSTKNKSALVLGAPWVLAAFILPLRSLWFYANSEPLVFGGLLPFSDASGFYQDALRLLNGHNFIAAGVYRPLFPMILAGLLSAAQGNLMVVQMFIAVYTGICVYFLGIETNRKYGPAAATLITIMVWLFWRGYSGTTMPEVIAPAWCSLGLALLLRGMDIRKPFTLLSGLFMISMALNIRQGAYFVLPAIAFWIGWVLRQGNRISARFTLLGAATIMLAIAINMIAYRLFVSPSVAIYGGGAVSSFPASLYGMTSGSGKWTYIFIEHPELANLTLEETSRYMLKLALDAFWENPTVFFRMSLMAWRSYFSADTLGMLGYVGAWNGLISGVPSLVSSSARWFLLVMAFLALLGWKKTDGKLAIGVLFGILLSVPFMPPWENGTRVYAATIPLVALLVTVGFFNLLGVFEHGLGLVLRQISSIEWKKVKIFPIVLGTNSTHLPLSFGMFFEIRPPVIQHNLITPTYAGLPVGLLISSWLSMAMLVVMMFSNCFYSPSVSTETIIDHCPDGQVLVNTHLYSGAYLIIYNNPTEIPLVRYGDFMQSAHDFMYTQTQQDFLQIETPAIIANVVDIKTSNGFWLIGSGMILPANQDIQICVQPTENPATRGMGFVYVR